MNIFIPFVNLFEWFVAQSTLVRILLLIAWTIFMVGLGWTIEHIADKHRRKAESYPRYLRKY